MTDTPAPPDPLKQTLSALREVLSLQRFQVVVERVRKQVKSTGEKRSKWIDTDNFTFLLFEGATISIDKERAQKLGSDLSTVVTEALGQWRAKARQAVAEAVKRDMTLSRAKAIGDHLRTIEHIDVIRYFVRPSGGDSGMWEVMPFNGPHAIVLTGTEKEMQALFSKVNRGITAVMQPFQDEATARLKASAADIP